MKTQSIVDARSEKGIALVVVLLLMAVLSGLATGFALNGRVEVAMSENEVYYAGARAAAEAGMNRATQAIRAQHDFNLLTGVDNTVDAANPAAAVNADNGDLGFMLTGATPYALDANNQYSYAVDVFDDDDPLLYETALTAAQLDAMLPGAGSEDGTGFIDFNNQLILRATGFGPSGTVVRLSRRITTNVNVTVIPPTEANPALLVDGDLDIQGNLSILGLEGNVHANGDMIVTGASASVSGDATSSGELEANDNFIDNVGGTAGGNAANINVPEINASDYFGHADFVLHDDGTITNPDGSACAPCPDGWEWVAASGVWTSDNDISAATYYAETSVVVNGNPGSKATPLAVSIISEGSVEVTGTPKFRPENAEMYQFITDGDLIISGNAGLDDATSVEGQILVREQLKISGNPQFQGRIIVANEPSVFDDVLLNEISGNAVLTYNGTLPAIPVPGATLTDYTYNVGGWMEQ